MASQEVIGFVGLDDLSLKLASSLIKSGFQVKAFQAVDSLVMGKFLELGGVKCATPMEAAKDASTVILLTPEEENASVLFGMDGLAEGLHKDAVLILQSALSASHIINLERRFTDKMGTVFIVDAHVFEGFSENSKEKLIVIASGRQETLQKVKPVISALGEKVYTFEGEAGIGSKVKMVNDLLEGIHLVASVEAMFLGVQFGIHPTILYDIISNAAGSSRIFVDIIPKILTGDQILTSCLNTMVKKTGYVLGVAKSLPFPLPLLAMAYQQLIYGSSCKCGDNTSPAPLKIWEQTFRVNIREAANQKAYDPGSLACQLSLTSSVVKKIGFIGLGAMGFGMAAHLLKSGFTVVAYDVYKPTMARFADLGGIVEDSPREVSKAVGLPFISRRPFLSSSSAPSLHQPSEGVLHQQPEVALHQPPAFPITFISHNPSSSSSAINSSCRQSPSSVFAATPVAEN